MRRRARGAALALALTLGGAARAAPRLQLPPLAELPGPARDTIARLRAEAEAAGLDASEAEGDVRATVVARGERPLIMIERPRLPPQLFRADDVPADEAPAVVALRAIEWLKAALAPPPSPAPRPDSAALARYAEAHATATSPYRRPHLSVALAAALDGGDLTLAPTVALGAGVGGPAFVRLAGWGPSTRSGVEAPQGSARIHSFGAAASVGWTWPLGESLWLAATAGLGAARYVIDGRSTPGFVARRATATSYLTSLDASVARPLAGPLAGVLGVAANFALPSVGVRIADARVAERGRPELRATLGAQVAF